MTAEPAGTKSNRLAAIEALRCVAASMIVVFHSVELPSLPIPSSLNVIRTHFGLGVPLFYSLSGFVLSYGYLDALDSRAKVRDFYVRRYFRIAPLFYVMLGVWIAYSAFKWKGFAVGPFEFLLNVSLLFGLVPGRHESIVWAGWSIGIEILFYLVFPVVAVLLTSRLAAAAAFCVFCVVSSLEYHALESARLGSFAYMNVVTHLPFFLSGIFAYLVWREDGFKERRRLGASLLLAVAAAAASIVYVPSVFVFLMSFSVISVDRYIWALVFAALILSVCYFPNRLIVNPITRYLGTVSFSLYLLHPFLIDVLGGAHKFIDTALHGGVGALGARLAMTFAVVIACASITYTWIEKPGIALGRKLSSKRIQTRRLGDERSRVLG